METANSLQNGKASVVEVEIISLLDDDDDLEYLNYDDLESVREALSKQFRLLWKNGENVSIKLHNPLKAIEKILQSVKISKLSLTDRKDILTSVLDHYLLITKSCKDVSIIDNYFF